jgi:hypothetical protein
VSWAQVVVWMTPSTQNWPVWTALPQPPQFWASCMRSTHVVLQGVSPGRQTHVEPMQVCSAAHAFPHPPQSVGLVTVSPQWPRQVMVPAGHWHLPALQTPPVRHFFPHIPQLIGSVMVFVQAPHTPLLHVIAMPQVVPQAPQFSTSI